VLHGSLGPEDEDGGQGRRGVSGCRGLRLLGAVDDFLGQLAALYDLAIQDVIGDDNVEQVRPVGATGGGGIDRDVAGIGLVCDARYGRGAEAVVLYGSRF
jgi:hypothetical protein